MNKLSFLIVFVSGISLAQPNNVLFIGNSFTHMNNLCKMYEHLAISKGKKVIADTLAVSGSSIKEHTERMHTYDKLKSKNWDYVFIQGYSRELSRDSVTIAQQTIPFTQLLIDSIKKYNPCVNIYFYMTWAYKNGFTDSIPGDTYDAMQSRIETGYLQLSMATGNFPVVPVGIVWKEVRETNPELNLYAPDNFHPNPYGSYIAACTFYTAIYKDSPIKGFCPNKVERPIAEKIQRCANDIVLESVTKYNLDTIQANVTKINSKITLNIKSKWLSISADAHDIIPGHHDYFWDFGDGSYATTKRIKHYYTKPGKYTITLSVKSNCSWYETNKTIVVSDNNPNNKNYKNTKK
jgi:hypothetical protein